MSERERLPRAFWALAGLFVLVASYWIAHRSVGDWDYRTDAGPPIDALIHGRLHDFLAARPVMGPLSLIFRAPFAALGQAVGHGGHPYYYDDYRYGVFGCLLVVGAFGLVLAAFLRSRGRGLLACAVVVVLPILNPITPRAIHFGHPEEILGAALLAGSMLAAVARRPWLAATLIALAIGNKQWAVLGLPAVAVALAPMGWARLRGPVLATIGLLALLLVPLLIADAHSLIDLTRRLADIRGTYTFPANVWYGFAPELPPVRAAHSQRGLRDVAEWVAVVSRPLIVALSIAIPLAYARRVRRDVLGRAFPLLALVMLLRCALDPADNSWYHAPFFFAVLAADGIQGRFYATAAAFAVLEAPIIWKPPAPDLYLFYTIWAPLFTAYLAGRAYGLDWMGLIRSRGARGRTAAPSPRSS